LSLIQRTAGNLDGCRLWPPVAIFKAGMTARGHSTGVAHVVISTGSNASSIALATPTNQ
jgi:hypothetical protein